MDLEPLNKETLSKINQEIKDKLDEWLKNNKPFVYSVEYYKPTLDFSNYENTTSYGIMFNPPQAKKEVLTYYHAEEFCGKLYTEYKEKIEGEQALYNYIKYIINYYLETYNQGDKGKHAEDSDKIVESFLRSYNDEPAPLQISVRLRGIGVAITPFEATLRTVKFEFDSTHDTKKTYELDTIQLSLRRPNEDDLKESREQLAAYDIRGMFDKPSAILEIKMNMAPSMLRNEQIIGFSHIVTLIEKVLLSLKLFNVIDVVLLNTIIKYESIINVLGFGNAIGLGPSLNVVPFLTHSGMLKVEKYQSFESFLNYIATSTSYNYREWRESNLMACDMYAEAIQGDIPNEKRITYVIIGIESLLSNSNLEIKYRLSLNVSKLMSLFIKEDGAEILAKLKLAYDIRSDYAHGNREKLKKDLSRIKERHGDENAFTKDLLGYLSKSIIIALGIDRGSRGKFIADLEALLVTSNKETIDKFICSYIEPNKTYLT